MLSTLSLPVVEPQAVRENTMAKAIIKAKNFFILITSFSVIIYRESQAIRLGFLAGAEGVEPSLMVLETTVKPFNYAPMDIFGEGEIFENLSFQLVGHQGLEPRTDRL